MENDKELLKEVQPAVTQMVSDIMEALEKNTGYGELKLTMEMTMQGTNVPIRQEIDIVAHPHRSIITRVDKIANPDRAPL